MNFPLKNPTKRKRTVIEGSGGGGNRPKKRRKKKKKKKKNPKIKYVKPILKVDRIRKNQILYAVNDTCKCWIEDSVNYKKSDMETIKTRAINHGQLFIGREYARGNGAKSFICTNLKTFVEKVSKHNPSQLRFHEMFIPDRLTKPVFDIEADEELNKDLNFVGFVHYFVNQMVIYFHELGLTDVHPSWFKPRFASRPGKFSAHIVMHKGYVLKTMEKWLQFSTSFVGWLANKEIVKLQKLKRSNNNIQIPEQRISLFYRDKDFREIAPPCYDYPFMQDDEDEDEEEEVTYKVYLFKNMIDFQPFGSGTHSLRCYFSVKLGHEEDERYRMRLGNIQMLDERNKKFRVFIEKTLNREMIKHCLAQCVLPTVDNIVTRVIDITNNMNMNRMYCETRLPKYTSVYYQLYGSSGVQESATLKNIIDVSSNEDTEEGLYKTFCSLYDRSFYFSGSFNRAENECKIKLTAPNHAQLYSLLQKMLDIHGRSIYIQKLFNGPLKMKLTMVKINTQSTALLLNVLTRCEIVMTKYRRMHTEHVNQKYTPGLRFKLWLESGQCYQRCLKEICDGMDSNGKYKKGCPFTVRENLLEQIRNCVNSIENQ
jgi:hypothetical protein